MRLRTPATLLAAAALLLAACGGGDDGAAAPTSTPAGAVPTATPFATVPQPIIVTDATPPGTGEVTYVVQPGDSLLAIASRFDTTVEAIQELNELDTTDIFVGQQLLIPSGSAPPGGETTPTPGGDEVYVVQPGDTALGIAFEFDVTLEELAAANGMTVDELTDLQVGMELRIPGR